MIGRHRAPIITTAPGKEAEERTADPIVDALQSDSELAKAGELDELAICDALSDKSDASLDELALVFKTRDNPEIVITHFTRLEACLDALRRIFGLTLTVPDKNIRHRNMAYLVNLTTDEAEVIEEKS